MDDFTLGYIECALWISVGDDDEPLDSKYDINDLAPETLAEIREDCARFQEENAVNLVAACAFQPMDWSGHDFWLTRNRHGAGFWDRGMGETGQHLTDAAHEFGEANLYIGDDGRIYCA